MENAVEKKKLFDKIVNKRGILEIIQSGLETSPSVKEGLFLIDFKEQDLVKRQLCAVDKCRAWLGGGGRII